MATKKEETKKEAKPKIELREYVLRDDWRTDNGTKKKGSKVKLSEGGAKVLKSKNLI